jgi:Domain of unknown function (DUF5658)
MKPIPAKPANDWVAQQLRGTSQPPPGFETERRHRADRRRRIWRSFWYGSFNPRRRSPSRRIDDSRFQWIDWHSADLLAVSIGILLLSAADAFLTAVLLVHGAEEANPVMAQLAYGNIAVFTALKMGMTGVGIVMMVFLSRYRFMRVIRVEFVMYAILGIYVWLIAYEIWMLKSAGDISLL